MKKVPFCQNILERNRFHVDVRIILHVKLYSNNQWYIQYLVYITLKIMQTKFGVKTFFLKGKRTAFNMLVVILFNFVNLLFSSPIVSFLFRF